jgi:hypothetical protein
MAEPPDDALYAPPTGDATGPASPAGARDAKSGGRARALDLLDAPGRGPTPAPLPAGSFWSRAAVTLGAAVLAALLGRIPMPGVDLGAFGLEGGSPGMNASVVALGLTPILSAYYVVELAALFVPRWRGLRHGGPAGRARIDRAVAIVAIVLALFQAYGIRNLFLRQGASSGAGLDVLLTLAAGTFLLWAIAGLVDRRGLGNGILWLSAAGWLQASAERALRDARGEGGGLADLATIRPGVGSALAVVAACAATVIVSRMSDAGPRAPGGSAADAPRSAARALAVPVPASGIQPINVAAGLVGLAFMFGLRVPPADGLIPSAAELLVTTGLVLGLGVLCAFLFQLPSRFDALIARSGATVATGERSPAAGLVWAALPATIGFVLVVQLALRAAPSIDVQALVLLTAWALDVAADLRARRSTPTLVPIWIEQRPGAAVLVREVLASRGIEVHLRGLAARTVLQFAAGYAPIEIHVPAADAARAARYLRAVLPDEGLAPAEEPAKFPKQTPAEEDERDEPVEVRIEKAEPSAEAATDGAEMAAAREEAPATKKKRKTRRSTKGAPVVLAVTAGWSRGAIVLALVAAAALALTMVQAAGSSRGAPATAEEREARRALLQVVLVMEDEDVLKDVSTRTPAELPAGVRFEQENAPLGPGRSAPRTYAHAVLGEGETLDALQARIGPWLRTIAIPAHTRLVLGPTEEWDEELGKQVPLGLRTYLVGDEPILTGADVEDAAAVQERGDDRPAGWTVTIALTPDSGERFRQATATYVKRRFAIVVEGRVLSAPVIQSEIRGGRLVITMGAGSLTEQRDTAEGLARVFSGR